MQSEKAGKVEEGIEFEKKDVPVEELVKKIPKKYKKLGECDKFAKKLREQLDKYKIKYEIIRIDSKFGIYSDKAKECIGYKYHYGVKVDDMIYDNMTPEGMNYDAWLDDLFVNDWEGALEVLINP